MLLPDTTRESLFMFYGSFSNFISYYGKPMAEWAEHIYMGIQTESKSKAVAPRTSPRKQQQ